MTDRMSTMDSRVYSKYFKAFGDPTRLRILSLLTAKEMTVNEITAAVGLSQPTVSRHLAVLRAAEAVLARREGQHVYYGLNRQSVADCCCTFCCGLQIPVKVVHMGRKKK